tara:strand:- start:1616 stop:1840 length:225 start_codon:yes stop_codon:yes gene_type:complete
MSKDTKENKEPDQYDHLMTVSNSVARSCVAVVDAMTQRGAIKGEELSTIGKLRDDAVQVIQAVESIQQEKAMEE